jgi:hypothetical protein
MLRLSPGTPSTTRAKKEELAHRCKPRHFSVFFVRHCRPSLN